MSIEPVKIDNYMMYLLDILPHGFYSDTCVLSEGGSMCPNRLKTFETYYKANEGDPWKKIKIKFLYTDNFLRDFQEQLNKHN